MQEVSQAHVAREAGADVIVAEGNGVWTEYAGGYTDMVAQRGFGVRAPESTTRPKVEKTPAVPPASPPAARGKLSFKQKHALETLPREMDKLRAQIAKANAKLSEPNLYTRDPTAFAAASKALGEAEAALAKAENDWLELEMIREELEG